MSITTPSQRDRKVTYVTAKTLPCQISLIPGGQLGSKQSKLIRFTLIEGRNRQIRKMAEAVGLQVVSLHRISFAGITLQGLHEGDWLELDNKEMDLISQHLVV